MTDADLWFEPVSLLSRCSLNEGLLWVRADRVPVDSSYREKNVFESLQNWEYERLKIPPAPEGIHTRAQFFTEERFRRGPFGKMPQDAQDYHLAKGTEEAKAIKQWLPSVTSAMELAAAELFLKFRRGQIEAKGKVLPDGVEIIDFLEGQSSYGRSDFDGLVDSIIPADVWTMAGIDWLSNALNVQDKCYCDVSLSVEVLMSQFPGERISVEGAQFVGDCLLVNEPAEDHSRRHSGRGPGRPPIFAWESFHVEVADLIKSGRMPQKKEAAIQQMLSWFATVQRQTPSRSAVSEKLTPYYRRFFSGKTGILSDGE
jgi:hypothetical protein